MKLLFLWAHTQFKKKRKHTDSFGETLLTMLILIFKEQHCIAYTPISQKQKEDFLEEANFWKEHLAFLGQNMANAVKLFADDAFIFMDTIHWV